MNHTASIRAPAVSEERPQVAIMNVSSNLWTVTLILAATTAAFAQEETLTPREAHMLEMIHALEARVAELETRLSGEESPAERAPSAAVSTEPAATGEAAHGDFTPDLEFKDEESQFSMQIGGRLHLDAASMRQDRALRREFGREDDGAEFRRAEIEVEGVLYRDMFYRTEFDFGGDGGEVKFKDVYVGVDGVPYAGRIMVGHIKEPIAMELLASSNNTQFMERSLASALAPGYNLGILASNTLAGQRMTWALGAFLETDDVPSDDDTGEGQGHAVTGRLTALPWYEDGGRRLFHLGAAYSLRSPDEKTFSYRARPEVHLALPYLDAGRYAGYSLADARADEVRVLGLEAAASVGPVSLQGEYLRSEVDTRLGRNLTFDGWYVEASWLLTGEHRPYSRDRGIFGRPVPANNFDLDGSGWGAWQVALRYSELDLDDGLVRGGSAENVTLGLNGYLNPAVRIMVNYVISDIERALDEGQVDILQGRVQFDF
jgi:phosphate-selective porin OprO/OprP